MKNVNRPRSAGRMSMAGIAIITLAGCAAATDVPSGMDHPADPNAAAAKMPHDGPMQHGEEDQPIMGKDGHDMSSMDMSKMEMSNMDDMGDGHDHADHVHADAEEK